MKYKCPCCGQLSLDEEGSSTYEICTVCGWENDGFPDGGGANHLSLVEVKQYWKKHKKRITPEIKNKDIS